MACNVYSGAYCYKRVASDTVPRSAAARWNKERISIADDGCDAIPRPNAEGVEGSAAGEIKPTEKM